MYGFQPYALITLISHADGVEGRIEMTTTTNKSKGARLEARIDPEQKELIQYAADIEGISLTDFMVSKLRAAAEETIQRHNVITLTREGSISFVKALLNPPEPNEKLREAHRKYLEYFGE
jgi:uncharacterized protein (DUF1778 family)